MASSTTLEDLVRQIVRDELRQVGAVVAEYTSENLPPGYETRAAFARTCRKLGIGTKNGRCWSVSAAEWHAARAVKPKPAETSADEQVDQHLKAAGLRLVKAGSR